MRLSHAFIPFSFVFQIESIFGLQARYMLAQRKTKGRAGFLCNKYKMRPEGAICYISIYIIPGLQPKNRFQIQSPRLHLGLVYSSLTGYTSNL